MKFSFKRFSESYIDTLAKLYRYSTTNYSKKRQSSVIGTDGGYTFAEFKKTCDGLSKALSCYGIGATDGVAILSASCPNWDLEGEKEFLARVEAIQKSIKDHVNKVVGKNSKIASVELQKESFKKTATMKIRRFLYKGDKSK